MSEDQFTKLFKHMEKNFASMNKRFDMQDKEIAELKGGVAKLRRAAPGLSPRNDHAGSKS